MYALTFERANKFYNSTQALKNFSLKINEGEIFALAGINGAGKTTAIKAILGLCRLNSGTITIFDEAISKSQIGFAPEVSDLPDFFTVKEILEHSLNYFYEKKDKELVQSLIETTIKRFSLENIINKKISLLSKGNKQRVSLAVATVHNPRLIIFDEPASGLDPIGRNLIKQAIKELNRNGATILFATHILSDITDLCDRFGIINDGSLLFCGTPKEFCYPKDTSEIETVFIDFIKNEKNNNIQVSNENNKILNNIFSKTNFIYDSKQIICVSKEIFTKSIKNNLILGTIILSLPFIYFAWIIEQSNPGFQTGFIADTGSLLIYCFTFIVTIILSLENLYSIDSDKKCYYQLSRINKSYLPASLFSGVIITVLPIITTLSILLTLFSYFISNSFISYPLLVGGIVFLEISILTSLLTLLNIFYSKIISFGLLIIISILSINIENLRLFIESFHNNILSFIFEVIITLIPDFSLFSPSYSVINYINLILYALFQTLFYLMLSGLSFKKKDL